MFFSSFRFSGDDVVVNLFDIGVGVGLAHGLSFGAFQDLPVVIDGEKVSGAPGIGFRGLWRLRQKRLLNGDIDQVEAAGGSEGFAGGQEPQAAVYRD